MTTSQMHEFARVGAEARLKAIAEERQAIFQVFPELGDGAAPSMRTSTVTSASAAPAARKRSGMSPAQRKAVGERMKAYWAKRRMGKAGRDTPQAERTSDASPAPATPTSKPKTMSPGRKAQAEKMRAYWSATRGEKQAAEAAASSSRKFNQKAGGKQA